MIVGRLPSARPDLPWVRIVIALVIALTTLMPVSALAAHRPITIAQATPVATPVTEGDRTSPGPGDTNPDLYTPIQERYRDDIYTQTAGWLSRYRIAATLVPPSGDVPATISGEIDLRYVNDTGRDLDALVFRIYANDERYAEGEMTFGDVVVAGTPVEPELSVADTVATVPLPESLPDGQAIDLTYTFDGVIPISPAQSYGLYATSPSSGSIFLAHWHPMLAGYGPDGEWNTMSPSVNSDAIFSNTSLYDVEITLPDDYALSTTGSEIDPVPDGLKETRRFVSGPVRDFTMVADDDFEQETVEIDGTTIVSWHNPGDEIGAEAVARYAGQALEIFNELLGPYPYIEMDFVQATIANGAAGIEFPQLMFIGGSYYDLPQITEGVPNFLENVVAHEVIHQWFFALVGNDQYIDAFIDEGITNDLTVYYFGEVYGEAEGARQSDLELRIPYLSRLFGQGDVICALQSDDHPSSGAYVTAVYRKASLGFETLREQIGEDTFFAALRTYVDDYTFTVATPEAMLAAFETTSGQDLGEFWRHWFEAAEGTEDFTPADLDAAIERVGRP